MGVGVPGVPERGAGAGISRVEGRVGGCDEMSGRGGMATDTFSLVYVSHVQSAGRIFSSFFFVSPRRHPQSPPVHHRWSCLLIIVYFAFLILCVAPPSSVDRADREELLRLLLLDLNTCGPKSRLSVKGTLSHTQRPSVTLHSPDAAQALLALKTLGKDHSGSLYLSSVANLSSILNFSSTFRDDPDAVSEALRTIANTLLLIAEARTTFIGGGVAGGMLTTIMLEVSSSTISTIPPYYIIIRKRPPQIKYLSYPEFCSFVLLRALLLFKYWWKKNTTGAR